jgi:hypothetical protein
MAILVALDLTPEAAMTIPGILINVATWVLLSSRTDCGMLEDFSWIWNNQEGHNFC